MAEGRDALAAVEPYSRLAAEVADAEVINSGSTFSFTAVATPELYRVPNLVLRLDVAITSTPTDLVVFVQVRDVVGSGEWATVSTINVGAAAFHKVVPLPIVGEPLEVRLSGTQSGVDGSKFYTVDAEFQGLIV